MKTHIGIGDSTPLARLAAQVDRIERQMGGLAALRADLDAHGAALRQLTEATRRRSPRTASPAAEGAVPEWMTVTDPQDAIRWLSDVWMWVQKVWDRYHRLPDCWPWHPPVVAELFAARQSWLAATAPEATSDGLSNWHDRWRPNADNRIHKVFLPGCIRADGLHSDAGGRWSVDPARLDELAYWWATTHGTTPAPGLTQATETHR